MRPERKGEKAGKIDGWMDEGRLKATADPGFQLARSYLMWLSKALRACLHPRRPRARMEVPDCVTQTDRSADCKSCEVLGMASDFHWNYPASNNWDLILTSTSQMKDCKIPRKNASQSILFRPTDRLAISSKFNGSIQAPVTDSKTDR